MKISMNLFSSVIILFNNSSLVMISPRTFPTPSLTTDLYPRLLQANNRISFLFSNHRYPELSVLLESLRNYINEYYKLTPSFSNNLQAIRRINKLRKCAEITLLHNQAVLAIVQKQLDQSVDVRTFIVEQLTMAIQGEQTRLGFLEETEVVNASQEIDFWRRELVRHYYFLATATYHNSSLEVSLAALMKGLDLIKESYRYELSITKNFTYKNNQHLTDLSISEQLSRFQQAQELLLLCQLKERVGFSKYLNIISVNTLIEIVSSLAKHPKGRVPQSTEFKLFAYDSILELDLPSLQAVISGEYSGNPTYNHLQATKVAHFLYYDLLSSIYSQQNKDTISEYQKLKNTKNVILMHVLQAVVAYHYLPHCESIDQALHQYQLIYKPKNIHQKHPISVYGLIDIFGLTPQALSEQNNNQQEDASFIQNSPLGQKNTIKKQKLKSNGKITTPSQPKSKSKSKSKSKPSSVAVANKGKQINGVRKAGEPERLSSKDKKNRVKEQYMLKRQGKNRPKVPQNHLIKAITHSFDSSHSKDRHSQRAIRTETCINTQQKQKKESTSSKALNPRLKK